ncbi:thioesterase family protein [Rhodococcus fascians]|nr:thioesterase family protein [Rhodococcus fascians]MBY4238352.1 thioesterase family protein [Rhodococcus fascians]MBY4254267.1 thioesterase family protein [Rhodococcus fascians]MBY4269648.1 thioesterase family protein [Rhodococcus fascians]
MHLIAVSSRSHKVELRWRDLDHQGHVYHGTMLALLDEARTQWFAGVLRDSGPDSYVVARIEIDYRNQLVRGDNSVVVGFEVLRIGKTSITLGEQMRSSASGSLITESVTTAVLWDRTTSAPRAITAEERSLIHSTEAIQQPEHTQTKV